jgi:transposase-like protein
MNVVESFGVYSELCQKRLRTINVFERLNIEFKRRTRKIAAFPSEHSLLRLVVSIMMDINEEWFTGRKYMNMR